MAYARVGLYTVKPDTLDAILTKAQTQLVPQTRQQPGFRRYFAIRTGEDALVSVTVWENKEQAEQAVQRLSAWVRDEMGPSLLTVENDVGELVVSSVPSGDVHGYARVARLAFTPGTLDAVTEQVRAELVPLLQGEAGFVGYGAMRTGENSALSVTASATKEQAQASGEKAAAWVQQQLGTSIVSIVRHEGEIVWSVRAE